VSPALACAYIAVCGMTVNSALLVLDALNAGAHGAARQKALAVFASLRPCLGTLLATTLTTVAAALPFVFLREGENLSARLLSLVAALGVGMSAIVSIILLPALWVWFRKAKSGEC
jgi:multidrug efflux pump subunit AcrB